MTAEHPTVLVLCVHNAGRSQMAAGWLRHLAGDRVDVRAGGTEPAEQVNPVVPAPIGARSPRVASSAGEPLAAGRLHCG